MLVRVAIAIVLLLLPNAAVARGKRIAPLIGNRAYDASVGVLKNPHNDIAVVGEALAKQATRYCRRSRMHGAAPSSVVCVSWCAVSMLQAQARSDFSTTLDTVRRRRAPTSTI